jgi:hypothetical protein
MASARDPLDRARQMAQFLREQPEGYLAAYRLMRCVRWDTLTEEAGGGTRLVAPRAELRAHMRRLALQKQRPELLDRVEQAFAEGANHFWPDKMIVAAQRGRHYPHTRWVHHQYCRSAQHDGADVAGLSADR